MREPAKLLGADSMNAMVLPVLAAEWCDGDV